jgi:hypothetical protein
MTFSLYDDTNFEETLDIRSKVKLNRNGIFLIDDEKYWLLDSIDKNYWALVSIEDSFKSHLIPKHSKFDGILINIDKSLSKYEKTLYDIQLNDSNIILTSEIKSIDVYDDRKEVLEQEWQLIKNIVLEQILKILPENFGMIMVPEPQDLVLKDGKLSKLYINIFYSINESKDFLNLPDYFEDLTILKDSLIPFFYEKLILYDKNLKILIDIDKFRESNFGKSLETINKYQL